MKTIKYIMNVSYDQTYGFSLSGDSKQGLNTIKNHLSQPFSVGPMWACEDKVFEFDSKNEVVSGIEININEDSEIIEGEATRNVNFDAEIYVYDIKAFHKYLAAAEPLLDQEENELEEMCEGIMKSIDVSDEEYEFLMIFINNLCGGYSEDSIEEEGVELEWDSDDGIDASISKQFEINISKLVSRYKV